MNQVPPLVGLPLEQPGDHGRQHPPASWGCHTLVEGRAARNEKSRPPFTPADGSLGESASVGRAAARPSAHESAVDEK